MNFSLLLGKMPYKTIAISSAVLEYDLMFFGCRYLAVDMMVFRYYCYLAI